MKSKPKSIKLNAVLNVSRTLMSLVFPLITFPYASRILQPERIGRYSFANSIVSYFLLIAGLGVSTYAIREGAKIRERKDDIARFANDVFSINVYATAAAYALLAAGCLCIAKLQPYSALIFLLSAQILLTTIGVSWIYSIYEDYTIPTVITIIMQAAAIVCLFVFVRSADDLYAYAAITVLAYSGPGIIQFFHARKYIPFRFTFKPDLSHMSRILIIFSTSIAATIYINSDITILGWIGGDRYTGLYGTAANIYRIVKQLLNAIVAVVVPRFAFFLGTEKTQELQKLSNDVMNVMIVVCLPAMVGLFCISRPLVIVFAGEAYASAADSLKLLSIALAFAIFANYFANCVLLAYNREKTVMLATILSSIINLVLNVFLIPAWFDRGAAFTTIIAEIVMCMIVWREAGKLLPVKIHFRTVIPVAAGCGGIALVCGLAMRFLENPAVILLVSVPVSVVLYGLIQALSGNISVLKTFRNIRRQDSR